MSKRVENAKVSQLRNFANTLLDLPIRMTEPSKSIKDEGERRKARFLSVTLFTGACAFPILQITSDMTMGIPYYSLSAILLAALYLLSRTGHVRLTSIITTIFAGLFAFVSLIINPVWDSINLTFQIFPWPILAVLVGSQILSKKNEAILIISLNISLVIVCFFHPGIVFTNALEIIGISFAIQTLIGITTWTTEYYSLKIEENNRTIERRRRELEIYTSLLRHDLSNDIQMILGGLELSQMTLDEPKKQASFLESTLAAAERMKSLIQIFSISEDELDRDLVSVLELICRRAEIAFKGMKVNLEIKEEVCNHKIFYGKLTALAFENLLRNTAQHAGESPTVIIAISQTENHLDILFEDDGPGVSEDIRKQLFGKGVTTGSKGRGLGLYLTKTIIESEGGSIELVDTRKSGCCFHIRLPLTYSKKP